MKFAAGVNVPKPLLNRLQAAGYEIIPMIEVGRRLASIYPDRVEQHPLSSLS